MMIFEHLSAVEATLGAGLVTTLIVIGVYAVHVLSFVSARPNEWLLVMRNGKCVCSGVGASFYTRLGDQLVKFPSNINRFKFSAAQITKEKQGIEVEGVLIWSVFRESDGPLRAYKFLGNDLTADVPTNANETLREMSNSIVRHRIANSTIENILTKRDDIRNEIRTEMQGIVNGWGVWLESVEITDVRILSSTLFENLQTEFREEQRQKAEVIKMNTDRELEGKHIAMQVTRDAEAVQNRSKQQVFEATEALKVQQEKQKLQQAVAAVDRERVESDVLLKKHRQTAENELVLQAEQMAQDAKLRKIERETQSALQERELEATRQQSALIKVQKECECRNVEEEQQRNAEKLRGELQNELIKGLDYDRAALNTAKEIYSHLSVKELRMVNMTQDGGGGEGGDGVMNMVQRLVASCNTTARELA